MRSLLVLAALLQLVSGSRSATAATTFPSPIVEIFAPPNIQVFPGGIFNPQISQSYQVILEDQNTPQFTFLVNRSALLWPSESTYGRVQLGNQFDGYEVEWQNSTYPDYVKWTWAPAPIQFTCDMTQTTHYLFITLKNTDATGSDIDITPHVDYPFYWTVFAPWCLSVLPSNMIPSLPTNVSVDGGAVIHYVRSNDKASYYSVYAAEGENEASISFSWSSCTGYWMSLDGKLLTQVHTSNTQVVTSQHVLPQWNTSLPPGCTQNVTVTYFFNTQFNTSTLWPHVESRRLIVTFFSHECQAIHSASHASVATLLSSVNTATAVNDDAACPNLPSPPSTASPPSPPVFQINPSSNVVIHPVMQPSIQSYQFVLNEELASDTVITLTFLVNSSIILMPSESRVGIVRLGNMQESEGIDFSPSQWGDLLQYTWTSPSGLNCDTAQTSWVMTAVTVSPSSSASTRAEDLNLNYAFDYYWTIFIPQCLSSQPSLSTAIPEVPLNVSVDGYGMIYSGSSSSDAVSVYNVYADQGVTQAGITISWSSCGGYWMSLPSEPTVPQPQVHTAGTQIISTQGWLPQLNTSLPDGCTRNSTAKYYLNTQSNGTSASVRSRAIIVHVFSHECPLNHTSTSSEKPISFASSFASSSSNLTCPSTIDLPSPSSGDLTTPEIVGIIVGVVTFVSIITGIYIWRRCRRAQYDRSQTLLTYGTQ